ncbi:MAG: MBL fold metallo-hydrolase, partial [Fusobacteriaceae bacterium]
YLSNLDKRSGVESFVEYTIIKENESFVIKDLRIDPFNAYHDAKKTLGFVINRTFGYLADCGYISNNIKRCLKDVEHLALEFNYHDDSIINSSRHHSNKLRTFDRFGHLSCEEGIKFIKNLKTKNKKLQTVVTLHPSNSHCDLERLEEELNETLYAEKEVRVFISNREGNETITLGGK